MSEWFNEGLIWKNVRICEIWWWYVMLFKDIFEWLLLICLFVYLCLVFVVDMCVCVLWKCFWVCVDYFFLLDEVVFGFWNCCGVFFCDLVEFWFVDLSWFVVVGVNFVFFCGGFLCVFFLVVVFLLVVFGIDVL